MNPKVRQAIEQVLRDPELSIDEQLDAIAGIEVPGKTVTKICPAKHLGEYCGSYSQKINCSDYLFDCHSSRIVTISDLIGG